jgi:hypothetical protein
VKKPFWARYQAPLDDGRGGEGGDTQPRIKKTAAQLNAERNAERLARIEEIGEGVDGRRAHEMKDVDGEQITGKFADGEFDDSPEAREERAAHEEAEAEQALREQSEAAERAEADEAGEARRLQREGTPAKLTTADDAPTKDDTQADEPGDEKVINGVRHYLTVVNGSERWLTLKELRTEASKSASADIALQRANDALKQASTVALTPKEEPAEVSEEDLENIILSASTGDTEAVKRLASVIRPKSSGVTPLDVSRQVAQQLQTQRAIDEAERASRDVLSNQSLQREFRVRLSELAKKEPTLTIQSAYDRVAKQMRTEFAPMLKTTPTQPSKADRKREIVNPPQTAGRQPSKAEDDPEEPVGSVIDRLAKARGQDRAFRQGRR